MIIFSNFKSCDVRRNLQSRFFLGTQKNLAYEWTDAQLGSRVTTCEDSKCSILDVLQQNSKSLVLSDSEELAAPLWPRFKSSGEFSSCALLSGTFLLQPCISSGMLSERISENLVDWSVTNSENSRK